MTANAQASIPVLEWTTDIQDNVAVLVQPFTITSLVEHTVSLFDNGFLVNFDSLDLLINKEGGATMVTLDGPGQKSFTPTVLGSYQARLVGDPGDASPLNLSTFGVTVAAVPEAETWAMMLVGMGLVGWQLRRKVKASAATRFV
jgi:hypothetical protein